MRTQIIKSVSRRLAPILALLISLAALSYSPPSTLADNAQCTEGCVNWNAQQGCIEVMVCCLFNDGCLMCWRNEVLVTPRCMD